MSKKERLISDSRLYVSMPNPWIVQEILISGSVSNKNIQKSIIEAFRANWLLGTQISVDPETGFAKLIETQENLEPISFYKEFQPITGERLCQLFDMKVLSYADVFKLEKKQILIRIYNHHLVCDGRGAQIITDDFIKILNSIYEKDEAVIEKNISSVADYLKYLEGGEKLSLPVKLYAAYFNNVIAKKRPHYTYEDIRNLQKLCMEKEDFSYETHQLSEKQTAAIISNAKSKGITVTAELIYRLYKAVGKEKVEASVSIDGRKYFNVPENTKILPVIDNPCNFATGGRIKINEAEFENELECQKNIVEQLKELVKPEKATSMIKTMSNMNFAIVDVSLKRNSKLPLTDEEQTAQKAIRKSLGYSPNSEGFDFASFGKNSFTQTHKKYTLENYVIIPNTASVYPMKFAIGTFNDKMNIVISYKPTQLTKKEAKEIIKKFIKL